MTSPDNVPPYEDLADSNPLRSQEEYDEDELVSRSGDPVAVAADAVDDLVRGFGPSEGPGLL
ncbi:hypothetical protein AB0M41_46500, partial [Streptomyces sp. NPDC051896]